MSENGTQFDRAEFWAFCEYRKYRDQIQRIVIADRVFFTFSKARLG